MVGKHIVLVIRLLGDRSGGAEKLYIEMANYLVEKGFRVSCLYYEPGQKEPFYTLDKRVSLVNLFIPYPSLGLFGKTNRLLSHVLGERSIMPAFAWLNSELPFTLQLKHFFKGMKVDMVLSYLPPANTPSLIAAKMTKTKIVVTNHNVPEKDYEDIKRWSPNPIDRFLRLYLLRYASKVHVLFEHFGSWFPESLQSKIVAIPNYVPDDYFSSESKSVATKKIIGVGRLAAVKNYETLVNAWAVISKEFPDWSVEIYGTGPDEEKLKALIKTLGVANSFFLMGHTSDVMEKYDESLIFCHPATHEGFGLSVAEALARDLPVVAYKDCEGVNQFVVNNENGLLIERGKTADSMAVALKQMISGDEMRKKLAGNAKESIRLFSETKYYQRYSQLITEVVGL